VFGVTKISTKKHFVKGSSIASNIGIYLLFGRDWFELVLERNDFGKNR